MKNMFTRELHSGEMSKMVRKMREDLSELISGRYKREEVLEYVKTIIATAKPLSHASGTLKGREVLFWGFDEPGNMPADCRVEYFYTPTYITVSFMIKALHDLPENVTSIEGFMQTLGRGLLGSTGRGFQGSGYDCNKGIVECLSIFASVDIKKFLEEYPDLCPEFTMQFNRAYYFLKETMTKNGTMQNEYGEDFGNKANELLQSLDRRTHTLFVYGTLQRHGSNYERFMRNSKFIGEGILQGYSLYDINNYPGIKMNPDDKVKGELFEINDDTLTKINYLEGEGHLYVLKDSIAKVNENLIDVKAYVYLPEVNPDKYVRYEQQPWGRKDLVWYVAYGSNMLEERFLCYINGGQFRGNGRNHIPCKDVTPPRAKMRYSIPYNMYFANSSKSWGESGVSFLDVSSDKEGFSYGVAYLISKMQFEHICNEENSGKFPTGESKWYNKKFLIESRDGMEFWTVTNAGRLPETIVKERYLLVLEEGLKEIYPEFSNKKIDEYLETCCAR